MGLSVVGKNAVGGNALGKIALEKCVCGGRSSWPTALTLGLLLFSSAGAQNVTSLEDIQFWVGSGANRAAMVLDWDDTSAADESLVWGYRWDGTATGEDMLRSVLEADTRLFARLSTPDPSEVSPYGLGYNLDNDSEFGISDGTTFDSDGIAVSGPPDNPPQTASTATDLGDLYAEGWFSGFWHYGLSDQNLGNGNPFDSGGWISSGTGMSGRTLADGDWDSWTFTPTFDFAAFAENPFAAESPFSADFDSDNDVDGADFLTWQRGFGINANATLEQGDANGDSAIDLLDFQAWSTTFGSGTTGGALQSAVFVVPEPSCGAGALGLFFCFISFGRRARNEGLRQPTREKVL